MLRAESSLRSGHFPLSASAIAAFSLAFNGFWLMRGSFFRTLIVSIRMSIRVCISPSLFESSALDSLPAFLRFVFFSSHEAAYTIASVLSELFV